MSASNPLVSVITPVYNGEKYLSECIESVLAQTYQEWEYIIVNNCSTDRTLEIARSYASKDSRITVVDNQDFVNVIQNHNIAFQQISDKSRYCKVIQADDFLFPDCLSTMVGLSEKNPRIGVVGAYSLTGKYVRCIGMQFPETVISGREASRRTLLGEMYPFFSPSSILIRSSLIKGVPSYYPGELLDADVDALFRDFTDCDFGFVFQVLTYVRQNPDSVTAKDKKKSNSQLLSHIRLLMKYGPVYLEENEYQARSGELWRAYYQNLALHLLKMQGREFWRSQRKELDKIGYPLSRARLMRSVAHELMVRPRRSLSFMKQALFSGR